MKGTKTQIIFKRENGKWRCVPIIPDKLRFGMRIRSQRYGDDQTFHEYQIAIFKGARLAGMEEGPPRQTVTRSEAANAARARIRQLQKRRLFAIQVTDKHITDGESRNCNTCAISQALWHNQERMGFGKDDMAFRVSTYAYFADSDGIVLEKKYCSRCDDSAIHLEVDKLPMLTFGRYSLRNRGMISGDSMVEWTMSWDEWAESRYMSLKEWREAHSYNDGERPFKPGPCSFVLDLDAFTALPA